MMTKEEAMDLAAQYREQGYPRPNIRAVAAMIASTGCQDEILHALELILAANKRA